ncbi:DUF4912 domain-containing protein [Fortiea contorta]|uniref:DUF4912 domain-containing protein n=1 Tax=Fortiea contorta TaxID=1892405 RepID=UPI00034CE750|nr:DUF4912 domain-containing protein [Fortiea contorta]
MWRQEKKDSSIVSLALLFAIATTPMAAHFFVSAPILAQSATETPAFALPPAVENGTTIRIDGANNLGAINQELKAGFEQQFPGTKVEALTSETEQALTALLDGKVDLVALSRGLTPEEKAQGLEQAVVRREKIAIIVGAENPVTGSLTNEQFAKIFRGDITDWSQLGAPKGELRIIDRPKTSDTRTNFRNSPVFKAANFATSPNATQIAEDNTAEIVKQLGKAGISYGLVDQLSKLQNVRFLQVDQVSPNDQQYPFSQPLVYVYKKNPPAGVAAFLGFAIAPPGQKAIDAARTSEAEAIAQGKSSIVTLASAPPEITILSTEQPATTPVKTDPSTIDPTLFLWLLLPATGGLLLWWLSSRRAKKSPPAATAEESINLTPSTDDTITIDNPGVDANAEITPPLGEAAWEAEAPAAVVNPPYQQLPDIHLAEPTEELPPTPFHPVENTDLWADTQVNEITSPDSAFIPEPTPEITNTIPELPELPEVALNALADAEELTTNPSEEETIEIVSPFPQAATTPTAGVDIATWESAADTQTYTIDNASIAFPPDADMIVFKPQTPKWAYVSWHFTTMHKQALKNAGVSQLVLRLYDVTGLDLSYQAPRLVQQYELDADARDRFVAIPTSDRDYITEISSFTENQWVLIARSPAVRIFSHAYVDADITNVPEENIIVITPRTPDWIYINWHITDAHKQALQKNNVSQLVLRLYDVTGLDLSYQAPQLIEEYDVEADTGDRFVVIPTSDRDYITEIGHITDEQWVLIARSGAVRVFSHPHVDTETIDLPAASTVVLTPRTPKWAYVNWHITDAQKQALPHNGALQFALRLYDVTGLDLSYQTPQLVQQYELELVASDRFVAIPTSDRDYITEIGHVADGQWVAIARSPSVRVFNRQHADFWFVADAELIIHGATEPNATVTIGEHPVKLKSDGTFHLRVPFSDNLIEYLMTAATADGKHTQIIHKKFSQETPEP